MIATKTLTLSLFAMLFFAATGLAQDPVPLYPDNYIHAVRSVAQSASA